MLRFIRRLFLGLILLAVCALGFVHFVLLEGSPRVTSMTTPAPEDVRAARDFVKEAGRRLQEVETGPTVLPITPDQLSAVATLGARFTPDYRGTFVVGRSVIVGDFSVPLPWVGGSRWLNVSGVVPEFDGDFTADEVRVGKLNVPPALAIWLLRKGGNLVVGDGFGDQVIGTPQRMEITSTVVNFEVNMSGIGDNGMFRNVFSSLRGREMPGADRMVEFERQILAAMASGELPDSGSYLPYIKFLFEIVGENSTDETVADNYTAGIIALAKICGARDFSLVMGGVAFNESADVPNVSCSELTLNERIDSRRHFTTAAALQAASNRGYSVAVGEFKELYDSLRSGGFDFTDLSANNSGIRLSDVVMSGNLIDLVDLQSRVGIENDVIISYDNIPQIMSGDDFSTRYGDIDSPEYKEMLAFIESRIDQLPIYQ